MRVGPSPVRAPARPPFCRSLRLFCLEQLPIFLTFADSGKSERRRAAWKSDSPRPVGFGGRSCKENPYGLLKHADYWELWVLVMVVGNKQGEKLTTGSISRDRVLSSPDLIGSAAPGPCPDPAYFGLLQQGLRTGPCTRLHFMFVEPLFTNQSPVQTCGLYFSDFRAGVVAVQTIRHQLNQNRFG